MWISRVATVDAEIAAPCSRHARGAAARLERDGDRGDDEVGRYHTVGEGGESHQSDRSSDRPREWSDRTRACVLGVG